MRHAARRALSPALVAAHLTSVALGAALALVGLLGSGIAPSRVFAYADGVNGPDCSGCHGVGDQMVDFQTTPTAIDPGAVIAFTISVRAPSSAVAGVNVQVDSGTLRTVSGGGLRIVGLELTHVMPMPIMVGVAVFRGEWVAPADAGAVRFLISSVAANGDGRRGAGDGGAMDDFDRVFGCESATFYRDGDGDGHGSPMYPRIGCAGVPPERFVDSRDDCDDLRSTVFTTAPELCNRRDDDCDDLVDETIEPVVHYPDADGDGYYGRAERESGEMIFGCPEGGRWASLGGDCAPDDGDINPGAPEVCNLIDDDCDGRADERVRPQCGIGWCRRDAWSCDGEDCAAGDPIAESCNLLDDDCDGPVDEDVCPAGQVCQEFECVPEGTPPPSATDGGGASGGGSASSGGCSATDGRGGIVVIAMLGGLALLTSRRRR